MANMPDRRRLAEADRRAAVRHPCSLDKACRLIATVDGDRYPAMILNLSTGGIGLLIGRHYDPGSVLAVGLFNTEQSFSCTLLLRVMYAVAQESGTWMIGGAFLAVQLSEQDLETLLL